MAATEALAMVEPLVRPMRPADAEAALALSEEAGWNQTAEDWRFMLGEGRALGVYEPGRAWVASSLVVPLGPGLAWISMVLVAGNRRRRGFGTMLLRRCIDAVRADGAVPGLDATELGRPVYLPLGFEDLYPISRWVVDAPLPPAAPPRGITMHDLTARDLPSVVTFDEARTHVRRAHILRYLRDRASACVAERQGAIVGYAMGRPGRAAAQIGPVVADDPEAARALVARMGEAGGAAILDVPDAHEALSGWLRDSGATRQRGYTRMTLGRFPGIEGPGSVYALAGPELA
jgi:ribosomal protein S18 acetylase RimI-like enzyme